MFFSELAIPLALVTLGLWWVGLRVAGRSEGKGLTAERLIGLLFGAIGAEIATYCVAAPELISAAGVVRNLSIVVANTSLLCFTWRVFRPDRRWSAGLALGLGLVVAASLFVPLVLQLESRVAPMVTGVFRSATYLWALAECWRYRAMMSRRVALGLGDPVLANRFLLWSLWTGLTGILPLVGVAARFYYLVQGQVDAIAVAEQGGGNPMIVSMITLTALFGASAALWLSFFPPAPYLRWVRSSQEPDAQRV